MARGGRGGEGGGNDDSKYLILFLTLVAGLWLVWYALRPQFLWIAFGMDLLQLGALDAVGLLDERGQRWMAWMSDVRAGRVPAERVGWDQFVVSQEEAGSRTAWFWVPFCVAMCVLVVFRMRGDGFRRTYTLTGRTEKEVLRILGRRVDKPLLQSLAWGLAGMTLTRGVLVTKRREWVDSGASFSLYQAKQWREALTGALFDPDAEEPSMAPQMNPPRWMKANGVSLKRGELDMRAAVAAFSHQLGSPWAGLDKAPPHVRAVMVMSALNVRRDKRLDWLRAALTECYVLRADRVDAEVSALLAPFLADAKLVRRIEDKAARHAYTNTACVAVYGWGGPMEAWGGKGGVLSTSLFLWLKRVDRDLWYALNNVGRRAFHIEGSGVISHYFMERMQRNPVSEPFMDNAVAGLRKYLGEYYIEDLDEYFNRDEDA